MEPRQDSLEATLLRRGLRVSEHGRPPGVLLPEPAQRIAFYCLLHRYAFRLFLRDAIKRRGSFTAAEVARYPGAELAAAYAEALVRLGLALREGGGYRLSQPDVASFGPVLEWYVAEILRRAFRATALSHVTIAGIGGDYDVLARLDDALLYVETKSSPPKGIEEGEVAAFVERALELAPEIAVFLVDTRLRIKDKVVPMFEAELARRLPAPPAVTRVEREVFAIRGRIFLANAHPGLAGNLRTAMRAYFAGRAPLL